MNFFIKKGLENYKKTKSNFVSAATLTVLAVLQKEQRESELKIVSLTAEISETEEQSDNLERFISKIHKYLDFQELNPTILNDTVKRV